LYLRRGSLDFCLEICEKAAKQAAFSRVHLFCQCFLAEKEGFELAQPCGHHRLKGAQRGKLYVKVSILPLLSGLPDAKRLPHKTACFYFIEVANGCQNGCQYGA
jgi:hypothetical protein